MASLSNFVNEKDCRRYPRSFCHHCEVGKMDDELRAGISSSRGYVYSGQLLFTCAEIVPPCSRSSIMMRG